MIAARALGMSADQIKDLIAKLVQQRTEYASRLLDTVAV